VLGIANIAGQVFQLFGELYEGINGAKPFAKKLRLKGVRVVAAIVGREHTEGPRMGIRHIKHRFQGTRFA
jgi:hypothetical protein